MHDSDRRERFMILFAAAREPLSRYARAITHDREQARDLVGETVLIAYEKFDSLHSPEAFLCWMFTIAHRVFRRNQRRAQRFGPYDEQYAESLPDTGPRPDAFVDVKALYTAIALLPEAQRETVVMFEISGLSLEEIRTIQGGTLSGVKSRLVRARARLAQLLGAEQRSVPTVNEENGMHPVGSLA